MGCCADVSASARIESMQVQPPEFERVKDLLTAAQDARRPTSYARHFENFVAANATMRSLLAHYEQDLLTLDPSAWAVLKAAAVKRLIRNPQRGWEPLFGILNEAKAYAYLAALGCTGIQMIPPSYDDKAPDLRADLSGALVLCEVKTLHMSDDSRADGAALPAACSPRALSEGFLRGKLTRALRAAKAQLDAYPSPAARKIVYVVFTPDESGGEEANDDSLQLAAFLKTLALAGAEVEIFQFPPLSSATA